MRVFTLLAGGWTVATLAAIVATRIGASPTNEPAIEPSARAPALSEAARWFGIVRDDCTSARAEEKVKSAPRGSEGVAFAAACLAIAGRTEKANELATTIPPAARRAAADALARRPKSHESAEDALAIDQLAATLSSGR